MTALVAGLPEHVTISAIQSGPMTVLLMQTETWRNDRARYLICGIRFVLHDKQIQVTHPQYCRLNAG